MSAFNVWAGNSFEDRVILRYGAAECIAFHDSKDAADEWLFDLPPVIPAKGEMAIPPTPPYYCAPVPEMIWLQRRRATRYAID